MQVHEVMTRNVEIIDPNTTIRDAARKMRADNLGALIAGCIGTDGWEPSQEPITGKWPTPSAGLTMHHKGRITMKRLLLAFITLAAATALTAPAFAGLKDAKNKAECEKAGGVWVEKGNKCGAKTE